MRKETGFTLVELMIVLAIIAIITAIAYPSYTASVLKGKRAQGRTALMELMQQQERYFTQNNCYLGFTTVSTGVATAAAPVPATACGGVTASSVPFKTFSGDAVTSGAYLLSADNCPAATGTQSIADCVRVIASPVKADALVGSLRMTSTGLKDCTGPTTDPKLCWP